ncbi:hypothetical protein D3C85_1646420 [compost metagenome]
MQGAQVRSAAHHVRYQEYHLGSRLDEVMEKPFVQDGRIRIGRRVPGVESTKHFWRRVKRRLYRRQLLQLVDDPVRHTGRHHT